MRGRDVTPRRGISTFYLTVYRVQVSALTWMEDERRKVCSLIEILAAVGALGWQQQGISARLGGIEARVLDLENRLFCAQSELLGVPHRKPRITRLFFREIHRLATSMKAH